MRNETVRSNIPKSKIFASYGIREEASAISSLHYHDELEFLPIYSGAFICTVDGVDYRAEAGEIIFINSGVPHSTSCPCPVESGLLQFKESNFLDSEITKMIKYSIKFQGLSDSPVKILKSPELLDEISAILEEKRNQEPGYDIYIKSHVYRILGYLYRNEILSDAEKIFGNKLVQKVLPVLTYINSNYSEDITLKEASEMLSFDPSYFCRIFKSAIGATFTEYLNFVRICKAEKLLARSDKSILEISEAVGFSSVSYFNRTFKKFRNCPPGYYRTAKYMNSI